MSPMNPGPNPGGGGSSQYAYGQQQQQQHYSYQQQQQMMGYQQQQIPSGYPSYALPGNAVEQQQQHHYQQQQQQQHRMIAPKQQQQQQHYNQAFQQQQTMDPNFNSYNNRAVYPQQQHQQQQPYMQQQQRFMGQQQQYYAYSQQQQQQYPGYYGQQQQPQQRFLQQQFPQQQPQQQQRPQMMMQQQHRMMQQQQPQQQVYYRQQQPFQQQQRRQFASNSQMMMRGQYPQHQQQHSNVMQQQQQQQQQAPCRFIQPGYVQSTQQQLQQLRPQQQPQQQMPMQQQYVQQPQPQQQTLPPPPQQSFQGSPQQPQQQMQPSVEEAVSLPAPLSSSSSSSPTLPNADEEMAVNSDNEIDDDEEPFQEPAQVEEAFPPAVEAELVEDVEEVEAAEKSPPAEQELLATLPELEKVIEDEESQEEQVQAEEEHVVSTALDLQDGASKDAFEQTIETETTTPVVDDDEEVKDEEETEAALPILEPQCDNPAEMLPSTSRQSQDEDDSKVEDEPPPILAPTLPLPPPKVFKASEKVTVPWGWKRLVLSDSVVYYSPSGVQFKNIEDVKRYLTRDGTCKCGLECPLQLDKVFDFDDSKQSEVLTYPQINNDKGKFCSHKKAIVGLAMRDKSNRFMERISHLHNPSADTKKVYSAGGKNKKLRQKQKPFASLKVSEMLEAREAERQRINEIISQQKKQHEARISKGDEKAESANSEIRRLSTTDDGDKVLSGAWTSPEKGEKAQTPLEMVETFVTNIDLESKSNSPAPESPAMKETTLKKSSPPAKAKTPLTTMTTLTTTTSLSTAMSVMPPRASIVVTATANSTPQQTVMQLVNTINGPMLMQTVTATPVVHSHPAPSPSQVLQPSFAALPLHQPQNKPILKKRNGKKKQQQQSQQPPEIRPLGPAVPILMPQQAQQTPQPQILTAQVAGNIVGATQVVTNVGHQMILAPSPAGATQNPTNPPAGVMFTQLPDGTIMQMQQIIQPATASQTTGGQQIITSGQFAGPIFANAAPNAGATAPGTPGAPQGTFFMTPQGVVQAASVQAVAHQPPQQPPTLTPMSQPSRPSTSSSMSTSSKKSPTGKKKKKKKKIASKIRKEESDSDSDDDIKMKKTLLLKNDSADESSSDSDIEEIGHVFSSPRSLTSSSSAKTSPKTFIQSNQVDSSGLQATPPHQAENLDSSLDTSGNSSNAGTSTSSGSGRKRKRNAEELLKDSWLHSDEEQDEVETEKSPRNGDGPKHFNVGEVVWGPHSNFPSWPGKVAETSEENSDLEADTVRVCWFGTKEFSDMETYSLKNLTDGLDAHHRQRKKLRKGRKLNPNLERAIQEAMMELD